MAGDNKSFLGTGWGFPPTFKRGLNGVEMVSAEQDIKQSLEILFKTKFGERVMESGYGTNIPDLIFEPNSSTFETYITEQVKRAILVYEPRIVVDDLILDSSRRNEGVVDIEVFFTIPQTNSRNNIVFPFYLNEGTNI